MLERLIEARDLLLIGMPQQGTDIREALDILDEIIDELQAEM